MTFEREIRRVHALPRAPARAGGAASRPRRARAHRERRCGAHTDAREQPSASQQLAPSEHRSRRIRRDPRDPRVGPRGAAAPHTTPTESAGATERLLRPPGRVIIGPLDGAAEHGPRRHTDEADDSRSEAALRSARRAPAGPESSAYQRPGPVRGYEGPASLRTVKLLLRPSFLVHAVALCFEEEVLLDEPLRHHELGSALALALAVGRRVATALAAVAAGARLARRCLASPATGSPVVPTAAPRRSAAPQRRFAAPQRRAAVRRAWPLAHRALPLRCAMAPRGRSRTRSARARSALSGADCARRVTRRVVGRLGRALRPLWPRAERSLAVPR